MSRINGVVPCANCCVAVPQDQYVAVENFGKFNKVLSAGLQFAGCDCCGVCISFRGISARVDQTFVKVVTKTKDNVFVTAQVAVQHRVKKDGVELAMYQLADMEGQIDSYVSDVVRSYLPVMLLDEAFEKKDDISDAVQKKLQEAMSSFGLEIRKALVTEIAPDASVVASMNEINKQKRLRDAALMSAEADKIRQVKAAEAAADASQLQGEGIARQRRAIIEGLRDAITHGTDEQLSTSQITELLLITQYFETLRDVAANNKSSTVFLNHSPGSVADIGEQIRNGMMQAGPAQMKMG